MSPELLVACTGCNLLRASTYAPHLARAMARWGIDTPVRQAGFIAQVAHESGNFSRLEEGLNYSAQRLTQVWPRRFPTLEAAKPFAANPEALANNVYSGRMGNTQPGDGFRFRGRGLKQLTGRDNYTRYARASGFDVVANPDMLLTPEVAADSAGWFWSANGCNDLADRRDWKGLTQKINGGTLGLAERLTLTQRALKALGAL